MGTTLTGTTPQDTYDSLIKVTDNGPLSGTAKYLSDGLGNDSILALSTSRVGIGTTDPAHKLAISSATDADLMSIVSYASANSTILRFGISGNDANITASGGSVGNLVFKTYGSERMRITSAGNVGIGTSSPSGAGWDESARILHVYQNTTSGGLLRLESSNTNAVLNAGNNQLAIFTTTDDPIRFGTNGSERVRVTNDGLTFNGDTAAANALDDYEEGTFTPTFSGTTATGGTVGGNYTKIGRAVYINIRIDGVTFSGSTGAAVISGLPFTVASGFHFYNFSCNYQNCVDGSSTGGFFVVNTTQLQFNDLASVVSATFIDGSSREIILSGFYFV